MSLHPSIAACRRGVRQAMEDLPADATVIVACSGGPDSLALASAAVFEGRQSGTRVIGATVDHGLQDGSADQAARVVAQLAAIGVDETVSARVKVETSGLGPEAAAREARYAVLQEVAGRFGAACVLLGHTRDDQAETVLLGLTRGSGGRSMAGMRRAFDGFVRPLLDVSRSETVTACQVEGLDYWEDPHNVDPSFLRPRVRSRVLPMLETELGPGVAKTLARTADQLREDMDHLDALADQALAVLTSNPSELPVPQLFSLPGAIRRRVLRLAALAAGSPPSELFYEHVTAVDSLVTDWHGQRWIDLPGHVRASRGDGLIRFSTGQVPGAAAAGLG
jgi:tRNA(Ile)-lysidine synthase